MRKLALASLLALIALPAAAADLRLPVKAPPAPTLATSGFYVGIGVEGAAVKSHVDWLSLPGVVQGTEYTPAGMGIGGVVGYRAWIGNAFFISPELDVDYLFARGSSVCGPLGLDNCSTKNTWGGAALVKLGMSLGTLTGQAATLVPANLPVPAVLPTSAWASALMPYVATGVRARDIEGCITGATNQGCASTTMWGWTIGGGMIMPVSPSVNLDLSVMFDDYNKAFTPGPAGTVPLLTGTWKSTHGVTAGLALTMGF
jgi:opacity protein-like surface antigen